MSDKLAEIEARANAVVYSDAGGRPLTLEELGQATAPHQHSAVSVPDVLWLIGQVRDLRGQVKALEREQDRLRFGLAWERGFTGPGKSAAIQYMRTYFGPLFPAWLQEEIQKGRALVGGGRG